MDSHDTTSRLVAAAHEYRARSWRVIQLHNVGPDGETCSCSRGRNCTSKGKHPRDNAWQNTEPYSGADIDALWSDRPKANVGLATGTPSGFWVLDIDVDHDGGKTMSNLVGQHGELPSTFVAVTGSGGYHYYFAMPEGEDVANSQNRVGPGVDVRGTGGQVVAPPSRTDKGDYRILRDADILPAPDWLLDLVRKPEVTTEEVTARDLPKPEDLSELEWKRLNAYAKSIVERECKRLADLHVRGWDGEPWNATTFQVACTLLEIANSPWNSFTDAKGALLQYAPRDDEGFDDHAILKIWDSAKQTVGDKARAVPPNREEEEDPLFDNPAVRRSDPTEPSGAGEQRRPGLELFGGDRGKEPLYANMATAVLDLGELAWGRDESFWSYAEKGVWLPDREVVTTRLVDLLGNQFRTAHVTNTIPVVKRRIRRLTGEPIEPVMNFANGMLVWRDGTLVDHDPSYGSTIQFPYDWDPDATCPRFEAFLDDILHEDYVNLAWEMLGYLLLSGNPLQVAFMFYGSGGNGKGTLMRVIHEMLGGSDNISTESLDDLNSNRFSAVNLFGKIANLAGDIDGTYQESTANFKKLTGEDPYPAERKFGDRFTFESWAVPVFSANKIPGSADVTEGYLRRWVILHFQKRITDVVPGLSNSLLGEVPGIAAKAIPALQRLMERKEFAPKGEALKGKEEFAVTIDQVRQWIASHDAIQAEKSVTPQHILYGAYRAWAERAGLGRLGQQEFGHRLIALGYKAQSYAGTLHHHGLMVSPTAEHHSNPISSVSEI